MGLVTERKGLTDLGTVKFQANELSRVIVIKKETAYVAAQKALDVIIQTLPSNELTVATVCYVMNEMKELLFSMELTS